ncbi:hypothetical protein PMIN05_012332 [Paraphaeosphaeria minitans]
MQTQGIPFQRWGLKDGICIEPYQIISVTEGFLMERTITGGGILGDKQGAGKTIQLLLKVIMTRHHKANYAEV